MKMLLVLTSSLKTTRSEQMGLSMPWSLKSVLVPRPWNLILRNGSCLVGVENVVESFVGVGLKTTRSEQMGPGQRGTAARQLV